MKKKVCFALAVSLLLPALAACGGISEQTTQTTTEPTVATIDHTAGMEALDGKKVIFIGNSHTYYSRCVLDQKQNTVFQTRVGDKGIFYQFCKANGIEVEVTNYTFGNHQLSDFYTGSCAAGKHNGHDHMADVTDFNYDYVILQQGTKDPENDLVGDVQKMAEPFKQANPNVKVIFLVHQLAYTRDYKWLEKVALLNDAGVTVVDWGGMLHGIVTGTQTVPVTQQTFDQNSFVISQSDSDGYHPNLLVGYVTAKRQRASLGNSRTAIF